jgi:oxygen-dependent protoporphyrinogen oxidase
MRTDVDVLVVGGGVAGLTAARELAGTYRRVLVLEREPVVGGRVRSVTVDGQVFEAGAAFVAPFYTATLDLLDELDLTRRLVERSRPSYVVRDGGLHPVLPPARLLAGHALGPVAKLRLARLAAALAGHWRSLDLADLARAEHLDVTSCADYLVRRVGAESLEQFFGPLLRGMLYWEAGTTSAPVLLAILKAFATAGASRRMLGGLAGFPRALARGLEVRTGTAVTGIVREAEGRFRVETDHGTHHARAVVCATTAADAAPIVTGPPEVRDYLRSVSYAPTAVLTLQVRAPAEAFPDGALLFPATVAPELAAVNAYLPPDGVDPGAGDPAGRLVHVYLSQHGYEQHAGRSDDDLAAAVVARLDGVLGRPAWLRDTRPAHVQRWARALPLFDVGHIGRARRFAAGQSRDGLAFAGDHLGGPYLDGAVRSGLAAARAIRIGVPG